MTTKKMGYEGMLLMGTAGSTATNQLQNARDITIESDYEMGETTVRGDSSSPPINTARPVAQNFKITWNHINKSNDTSLATLVTAHHAGTAVALRGKDYTAGMGPDADFYIASIKHGMPYKGEQTFDIEAVPTDENRSVSTYV